MTIFPLFSNMWKALHLECNPSRNTNIFDPMKIPLILPIRIRVNWNTRKGWSISAKIVFSDITWSTYFNLIISAFFRIFIAKYSPVFLFLASLTRPNDPKEFTISKTNLFPRWWWDHNHSMLLFSLKPFL